MCQNTMAICRLELPLRLKTPQRIFVNPMGDLILRVFKEGRGMRCRDQRGTFLSDDGRSG